MSGISIWRSCRRATRGRGRLAGTALPGDLAAGAGADLSRGGRGDGLCAALGRAAAGALQRLRAVEPRRPSARQPRRAHSAYPGNSRGASGTAEAPARRRRVWTAKKVAAFMAAELRRAVAEQRGWEALRAIGWTIQSPRPQHAEAATPEEQEAFKKGSRRPSPRRPSAIPRRRSRSSPPTSIVSD